VPFLRRITTGSSLKQLRSNPYEHELDQKHTASAAPSKDADTIRYFSHKRQAYRVFISCFRIWLWTVLACALLAGTLAGFASFYFLRRQLRYTFNALVTLLSVLLGLAFAAQFKRFAEMMRWRILASQYRTIEEFEEVLGVDSWRSVYRLMIRGRKKGSWWPTSLQVLAFFWLALFIAFNVCTALLGLTYSFEVSDSWVLLDRGNVSVVELSYLAVRPADGSEANTNLAFQQNAANLYGQSGQNFRAPCANITDSWLPDDPVVSTNCPDETDYWYRFIDVSPDNPQARFPSERTVNSSATCVPLTIEYGGYAGNQGYISENYTRDALAYYNSAGDFRSIRVAYSGTGRTTYIGVTTEDICGPRCSQVLVLLSANNYTQEIAEQYGVPRFAPVPRLWECNNTVSQVTNTDKGGFSNETRLQLPDRQAQLLAGAIGWSGIDLTFAPQTTPVDYQNQINPGDNRYNLNGTASAAYVASNLMRFTTTAIAAMDQRGGPRVNMTGDYRPSPAQYLRVEWQYAGTILAAVPVIEFVMLLAVVWFSSKVVILEPSYVKTAHLMEPVVQKLGPEGKLMTVKEISRVLGGKGYKIAYGVRLDEGDGGGHHDEGFVRQLDVVEKDVHGGTIGRQMPSGRYS
jgi:hypothetical protein